MASCWRLPTAVRPASAVLNRLDLLALFRPGRKRPESITADGIAWYPHHPIVPRKAVAELPVLQGVERLQEYRQLGIGDLDRSHAAAQAAHCWQGRLPTPFPSTRFFAGIC